MEKLGEKQNRQQKGLSSEIIFEKFCNKNGVSCIWLERDNEARIKFLENPQGKCPDFLCSKDNNQIFVEVKTHTLLTNMAREKIVNRKIIEFKAAGLSGGPTSEPFDPIPELKVPFEGYLRKASEKFKNIDNKNKFPRVLLLDGFLLGGFDIPVIFLGVYPSYRKDYKENNLVYVGLSKKHFGLFDSTGSNVSAIVYWNKNLKRYEGMANPRARIALLENDFKKFFEIHHD